MTYICRCEDGPAEGTEFRDYGPPVKVDLSHEGQVLKYRLSNILDGRCDYQFLGLSDDRSASSLASSDLSFSKPA
ncbi:MAG: hypothetical protein V1873_07770 [Verrucomicrobiota bacterium]